MHGHGTIFTPPGEILEANFQNGKIAEGKIKILVRLFKLSMIQYLNGDFYEGDFRQNRRNGKGTHYYALTGDCYEGDFMNDRRVGKGKMTFAGGSSLINQFIDD